MYLVLHRRWEGNGFGWSTVETPTSQLIWFTSVRQLHGDRDDGWTVQILRESSRMKTGVTGLPWGWKQMLWDRFVWRCKRNVKMETHSTVMLLLLCLQWQKKNPSAASFKYRPMTMYNKLCGRSPQLAPAPCHLDLLTLKMMYESRLTWAISVPILVFLGLSVLDLGPMYATDVRQHHCLMPPPRGRGHNNTSATIFRNYQRHIFLKHGLSSVAVVMRRIYLW